MKQSETGDNRQNQQVQLLGLQENVEDPLIQPQVQPHGPMRRPMIRILIH